jgi:hypothetical protein
VGQGSQEEEQLKKSAASSGGGFGKVEEKVEKDGNYSVFPALEKQVADTLIPSTRELFEEAGELPSETNDRLD